MEKLKSSSPPQRRASNSCCVGKFGGNYVAILIIPYKSLTFGGEGGIRTLGTFDSTPDFESGTFDHSATSPNQTTIIASHSRKPA